MREGMEHHLTFLPTEHICTILSNEKLEIWANVMGGWKLRVEEVVAKVLHASARPESV